MPLFLPPAPEPQPRVAATRCKRSCCFTPYMCAKQLKCACHQRDDA